MDRWLVFDIVTVELRHTKIRVIHTNRNVFAVFLRAYVPAVCIVCMRACM